MTFRKKVLKCWPASAAQQTVQATVYRASLAVFYHPLPELHFLLAPVIKTW